MQPPSEFTLETSQPLNLAAFKSEIKVFRFKRTDFRLIFVHLPGPLSCASIVVPTICEDNKGLAHTLEHLVFCGSKSIPHRGYLDNLANRCLSTGTNAYTAQDHTCYEITTAGWQGMLNVFPTFLDHILHPTLKESQFTTEVYHLDHQAKHQGVVYCEMASREDTEADLLDMELRRLVYQNSTTYSHECGGLTEDIAKLSNKEIIEYHKQYYHLGVITAIITGDVRPDDLFKELLKHPELFDNAKDKIPEILSVHPPSSKNVPHELVSSRLKFASAEEDVGSIGFAWMGPASEDFKTIVAIDVLFRHLHETPASLLAQKFVETASPLASDIDFELKGHVDTCLCLIFSGVPFSKEANGDDQIGDGSTENSASGSDDGENSESPSVISERDDLFDENVFFNILKKCLTCWIDQGIPEPEGMLSTLKRHRQKVEEAFEEEPHEVVTNYIIADVIRYFLSEKSKDGDTRAQKGKPSFKGRSKVLDVIDELEKEPVQFWIDLAKKWLIDAPTYQVLMIPDAQMAIDKSASEVLLG